MFASIQSYIYFFRTEGLANKLLRDEMVLRGSDGTTASVYCRVWNVYNSF